MKYLVLCFAGMALLAAAEYPEVMAETNLEKRSEVALRHADAALTAAKQAYDAQKFDDYRARIADVVALSELSYKSLQDSGKRARRSPKYFKRAELRLRGLMRRIDGVSQEVSVDDRELLESVKKRVNEIHDQVLHDIMTKK